MRIEVVPIDHWAEIDPWSYWFLDELWVALE